MCKYGITLIDNILGDILSIFSPAFYIFDHNSPDFGTFYVLNSPECYNPDHYTPDGGRVNINSIYFGQHFFAVVLGPSTFATSLLLLLLYLSKI